MADADDLLRQADRLMKRHRVFVAAGAQAPEAAEAVPPEELPVLTDVVEQVAEPTPVTFTSEQLAALAQELLYERLPLQRQALADELAAWLDNELPQVVMRVLDGVTDQLVAQVTREATAALLPRLQSALDESPPPAEAKG